MQERESEQLFAARQEQSQREQESEQRAGDPPVGNVLAEIADNNEQILDVAVDENIGNQANNNNNDNVMMGLIDAAANEYIDYQANDNESHDVVNAPVGDILDDIGTVENIENQEDNNNDNQDVVDAPVGNVTDQLFVETANENIGIMAILPRPNPTRSPQTLSEQQSAAREEPGMRERESERQFAARQEQSQ